MKFFFSFIRWKYMLPLLIVVAAMLVFFIFFFDSILTWGIQKAASKANGAKVEVSHLKTKLFQGRLSIEKLQVTNAKRPMENIVEAGPLVMELDPSELVKKHVIINESSFLGLAFNTPRKTSGALPKIQKKADAEPSAAARLAEKYKDRFKLNLDGLKQDLKSKIEFDPKQLTIVKQGDELKEKATTLPDRWKTRVDQLDVDGRLKKAEDDLKSVRATPTSGADVSSLSSARAEALTAVPASLKKLKQTRDDLNKLLQDVQNAKRDFGTEAAGIRGGVTNLSEAKKKDEADILSRLKLDFASPERLLDGIIGPAVLGRFQTVMTYVEKARKYMPSKFETANIPPPARFEGRTIEFPTPAARPTFWLKHAALGGVYQNVMASGVLTDVTTDPTRIGKPLKLDLSGALGAQRFLARAVVDHVGDDKKDSLDLEGSGLPVKSFLSDGPFGEALRGGVGSARLAIDVAEEGKLGGTIDLKMAGLTFDETTLLAQLGASGDALKAQFARNLAQAIQAMPHVAVVGQLSGTLSDPSISLSSNLGGVLANVIKQSIGDVIGKQRQQLEAQLDQIVKGKTAEVDDKLKGAETQVNQRINALQTQVQQKISAATGINLSPVGTSPIPGINLPSLNGLFKKK